MAWVEILPRYISLFRQTRWESASAFLAWTGILVNQHRHRQVEQVTLNDDNAARSSDRQTSLACAKVAEMPAPSFFLKKEYAVSWRDRMRNAWHGFGWCATAVREGAILQALQEAGIGCPDVAALGEHGRGAFLLVRAESAMMELRAFLLGLDASDQHGLADALGRVLARMHEAGFDHPDLFAKHILVSSERESFRFCILDWQRGRRRRSVSLRLRIRDLAMLDATLHRTLASDRLRLRVLRSYCKSSLQRVPMARLADEIRRRATGLLRNRNLREVGGLPVPAADQQFVPVCDGQLLMVRSYLQRNEGVVPEWLAKRLRSDAQPTSDVSDSAPTGISISSGGRTPSLRVMPEIAHTLFRLQRFGVPAPRLLAVGFSVTSVFAVMESVRTVPFRKALAKATVGQRSRMLRQAGWIVRQIHEAGYHLPAGETWEARLGVVAGSGDVHLASVEPLPRDSAIWQELAPLEFARQRVRLSRTEQLRFFLGYLQRPRMSVHDRQWIAGFFAANGRVLERQAVS